MGVLTDLVLDYGERLRGVNRQGQGELDLLRVGDNNRVELYDGRLVITADGRVGVGTASPADTLHVAGGLRADGGLVIGGPAQLNNNVAICSAATQTLAFFGAAGAARQTVTGSRGANAALASLLTALAAYGLIVDSTSA